MNKIAFRLYILFIISFFLHLPDRIHVLGVIRFDLLLVLIITSILFMNREHLHTVTIDSKYNSRASIFLITLLVYVFLTLPFVRWTGSVLHHGLPNLIKALIFYYFTIKIITDEKKLKIFMSVFIICQVYRVLEPLYMNYLYGYWGSQTYMDGEMMDRLSGSPYDVINPNGLAFVIVSVLPFIYYISNVSGLFIKTALLFLVPILLYALILTSSRTGVLALCIILFGIFLKSNKKFILILLGITFISVLIPNLTDLQKDRYLSIFKKDVRGAQTAQGRLEGISRDFSVAMERPFFGHGLGTSQEANTHVAGVYQPAHNLYLEILQELGLFGLIIFLFYIKAIIKNFIQSLKKIKDKIVDNKYMLNLVHAMQVWLTMNILFSFASYGLSSYEWYLFGGLSVAVNTIAGKMKSDVKDI